MKSAIVSDIHSNPTALESVLRDAYGSIHNVPKAHLDAMRDDFVSEDTLKEKYKGNRRVHFGLPR